MPQFNSTDRDYLLRQQYRDASNLSSRMNLHERFSTNLYGWPRWVFDRFAFHPGQRVLELGCGTGALWQANQERLPGGCSITLSDLSPGMLHEARRQLGILEERFDWEIMDAQAIPHPDDSFDVIIANHMLYHIPNRDAALGEIRRVLAADGVFYAATNGYEHMRELEDLFVAHVPGAARDDTVRNFSLEHGEVQLQRHFRRVTSHKYADSLEVTESEPLLVYLLSGLPDGPLDEHGLNQMRTAIAQEIERNGAFHVTKSAGLFQCSLPLDLR